MFQIFNILKDFRIALLHWFKNYGRIDYADLQISNSNQSNQNLERLYIWGVVCLFVCLVGCTP